MRAGPVLLVACLLAAGCAGNSSNDSQEAGNGADSSSSSEQLGNTTSRTFVGLANCLSWTTTVYWDPADDLGGRPQGWDHRALQLALVSLTVLLCETVDFGSLHLTDIPLIVEGHSQFLMPQSCSEHGHWETGLVLTGLWTNHTDFALALANHTGMTTHVAEIQFEEVVVDPVAQMDVIVRDASGESRLTYASSTQDSGPESLRAYRFAWPRGAGVGLWDMDKPAAPRDGYLPVQQGAMAPPFLYSRAPGGQFAGTAQWNLMDDSHGHIELFEDTACKQPVEPPGSQSDKSG